MLTFTLLLLGIWRFIVLFRACDCMLPLCIWLLDVTTSHFLDFCHSQVQNKDIHIGKLEKDLQEMAVNRDMLLEEKK